MNVSVTSDVDAAIFAEKQRLSEFPYFSRLPDTTDGVLLSDQIQRYSEFDCKLIDPFDSASLRPAGYDLRVGGNYAIEGVRYTLGPGQELLIRPYSVAVIQTRETLNIPHFLIGRWNIRVKFAYRGLLWVGGAQVDPGFRGRLSCPIYNLSTEPVTLKYEERLAMIDFVTTTSFVDGEGGSQPFQWWRGKSLIFQEYDTKLTSGVAATLEKIEKGVAESKESQKTQADDLENKLTGKVATISTRIDNFLILVFTVVAILFAGLGVIATKGSDEPSFFTSPVFVAAVALYLAFRAFLLAERQSEDNGAKAPASTVPSTRSKSIGEIIRDHILELSMCLLIVVGSISIHYFHAYVSQKDIRQAKEESSLARRQVEKQKQESDAQLYRFRVETDAKISDLQKQVERLQSNSEHPKR
jgi:deoxycytidine triphosphate deaminase